jgi:hypothetical protein
MKRLILLGVVIALFAISINPVLGNGSGTIRISPALPMMVTSPATFEIWIEGAAQPPTNDPHILLVMTNSCHDGLTDDVVVTWTGDSTSFSKGDFTPANTGKVPASGAEEGGRYTVASLQDHIGVPHSEMVYYVYGPFLAGPITQTAQTFNITLPSTDPRMLVYAIGKTGDNFDNKVPPTIPGFLVPELGPILLALASFSAFAIYAVKRRKTLHLK